MSSDGIALPVAQFERPGWKTALNWTASLLLAFLFLIAGVWKVTDPTGAAVRLAQAKVPEHWSLLAAISLGITETFAGVLTLVPRYRRWGSWIAGGLLVFFMLYIGFYYDELRGQECSCFPWVKRAVGPAFFVGDAAMLALAAAAGIWAKRSERLLGAILTLGAVCVFALVSYGAAAVHETGTKAPGSIMVDGKPYSLESGKIFLFFFDPACLHCLGAARKMSAMNWGDTKVIGVPVTDPQSAPFFMEKSKLNRPISSDWELLKKTFAVKGTPGAVAIQNGRQKAELTRFEDEEPDATLRKLGFIY